MSDVWISKLAGINKATGFVPGPNSPVPTKNILAAFKEAGLSIEKQAQILSGFMATVDVNPAEPAAPTAPSLTLKQMVDMVKDPSKHAELVAQWKAMPEDARNALKAQLMAIKPTPAKPAASPGAPVQAISKYMNNWAAAIRAETDKSKKIQLAKEIVNFLADRKDTPEAQSAVPAAIAILKRSNMGPIQAKLINSLKSGLTMKESMQLMDKLLLDSDLTWTDLGLQVVLNEHTQQIEVNDIMQQIKQALRLA